MLMLMLRLMPSFRIPEGFLVVAVQLTFSEDRTQIVK